MTPGAGGDPSSDRPLLRADAGLLDRLRQRLAAFHPARPRRPTRPACGMPRSSWRSPKWPWRRPARPARHWPTGRRRRADPDPPRRRACAATPANGRCRVAASTAAKQPSRPRCANWPRKSVCACTPSALLGRLDDFVTRSGYLITPVVVWAGAPATCAPTRPRSPASTASRPGRILRGDAPMLEARQPRPAPGAADAGRRRLDRRATAAMIYQFREVCLLGRETRVAHFDQPDFAWR